MSVWANIVPEVLNGRTPVDEVRLVYHEIMPMLLQCFICATQESVQNIDPCVNAYQAPHHFVKVQQSLAQLADI
jgi:hypothetical protein